MLTNTAVKAAEPAMRARKLFDAGGLFLFIAPSGLKGWRLKYRFGGKEKLLVLGRWPAMSLADARTVRDAARTRLHQGEDPAADHIGDAARMISFEVIARTWHDHHRSGWSDTHAADVLASLERDIFPAIGALPIGAIEPPALLNALRSVEQRGCIASARRIRQRLSAIFGYAVAEGLAEKDPAALLGRAMLGAKIVRPQPALSSIEDCRDLLAACRRAGGLRSIELASRFLALTAVRLDALRGARWDEFEQLDGPEPLWRIPPARMKLAKAKKDEARFAHLVPLSSQAVAVLKEVAGETFDRVLISGGLVFPGRGKNSPIGEGAIGALYVRAGFSGRHVPHGWRSSFSTILNEQLPEYRGDIDRALAHSPKDKVEAAYNRAAQLPRRRELYARWGDLLAG